MQRRDLRRRVAADKALDMSGPALQGGAPLVEKFGPIINPGDAAAAAPGVIYDQLNNIGPDTELGHAGDGGSPEVV